MDGWESFDECDTPIPREIIHLDPEVIKRVQYVLFLCEKRSWGSINTVVHETYVSVAWQVPVSHEVRIFYDSESVKLFTPYDSVTRTIEMNQLESSLLWHLSRELSLNRMKQQFCDLFQLEEQSVS